MDSINGPQSWKCVRLVRVFVRLSQLLDTREIGGSSFDSKLFENGANEGCNCYVLINDLVLKKLETLLAIGYGEVTRRD